MKKVFTVVVLMIATTIFAQSGITVFQGTETPQDIKFGKIGIRTYDLAAAEACTTKGFRVGHLGGFSVQIWDSVRQAIDTAIIQGKFQIANYDTSTAYSCSGLTDSIFIDADTICGNVAKKRWSKVFDFTSSVYRANYVRFIFLNNDNDSCHGLRVYPLFNADF